MKIIKITYVIAIFLALATTGCKQEKRNANTYTINGKAKGVADGTKVYLKKVKETAFAIFDTSYDSTAINSTVIKDGAFTLEGSLEHPDLYIVQIDIEQENVMHNGREIPAAPPAIPIFMENSEITIATQKDSLTTSNDFFKIDLSKYKTHITGSKSHELYLKYLRGLSSYEFKGETLSREYFNHLTSTGEKKNKVSEGIAITKKIESNTANTKQYIKDFVKNHSEEMMTLYVLKNKAKLFDLSELNELENDIPESIKATQKGTEITEVLRKKKTTAVGAHYIDLTLKSPEGEDVVLSDHVAKGKYVLLEFWASWCGPCRGEIPHLKEIYNLYNPEGFEIISVSIDQRHEDWVKAMKEEQMPWRQLTHDQSVETKITDVYSIMGIPGCVLIDPSGKIVHRDFRGSYMDNGLIAMYGNKFGDTY